MLLSKPIFHRSRAVGFRRCSQAGDGEMPPVALMLPSHPITGTGTDGSQKPRSTELVDRGSSAGDEPRDAVSSCLRVAITERTEPDVGVRRLDAFRGANWPSIW